MVHNCSCEESLYILDLTKGNSKRIEITLDEDLTGYSADLIIRKSLQLPPVLKKTVDVLGDTVLFELLPEETDALIIDSNAASMKYIWGVDVYNAQNVRVSIIPKTGEAIPLCRVYPDVAGGSDGI